MEYYSYTPTASYLGPVRKEQTFNFPNLASMSTSQDSLNTHGLNLKRSLTTMPWRPSAYHSVAYSSPRVALSHSQSGPLSTRAQLTELEGLRVPPVFSAARNALYTRYTPSDWLTASLSNYSVSDKSRAMAERVRFDSIRLGKETDDRTKLAQDDSGKKLGERVSDTHYWKTELQHETDNMISEIDRLNEAKRVAEKLLAETENPLHITQECLYNREKRQGVDLVHDTVEKDLLGEVDVIKNCQERLRQMIARAISQQSLNRAAQHELEKDSRDKFMAQQLDEVAHGLNNHSAGLNYYHGVERIDNCISVPETWAKFSNNNIQRSQSEREASRRLRDDIERCINECTNEMWTQWNKVNSSLTQRIQETTDARNKTQTHLNKVLQEIFDMEKNIEYIKKCINDKEAPLMVAQTRLNTRLRRPNMEFCRDPAQNRLVEEAVEIQETIAQLKRRLAEAEDALQVLLRSKNTLEHDLSVKDNSLFIDRERCQGIRKTFPVGPKLSFA